MLIEMGNPAPTTTENSPAVTYFSVPDTYGYVAHDSAVELANAIARHLVALPDPRVTRLGDVSGGTGDHEAFLAVLNGWRAESSGMPSWVWSDDEDFAVLLGAFFGCPVGRPDDLEATHFTTAGAPGVFPPEPAPDPEPEPEVSA
jgi:hypothetical protein